MMVDVNGQENVSTPGTARTVQGGGIVLDSEKDRVWHASLRSRA